MIEHVKKILVPIDFSKCSEVALSTAAVLAKEDDATVHLLHSIRLPFLHTTYDVNVPESVWEGLRKGTQEKMAESRGRLEEAGVREVNIIVSEVNQPSEAIKDAVEEFGVDLVVMATQGRRAMHYALLGSVTQRTLRSCPVPVLAVKGAGITDLPLRRILVPIDFSTHSDRALDLATSLAKRYGAHLDIIHVVDRISESLRFLSAAAVEFEEKSRSIYADRLMNLETRLKKENVSVRTHLPDGNPGEVIAHEAEQLGSDLIVMGTHGFTGLQHIMLGSVAEHTLRLAPCSVLTTKAPHSREAA